MRRVVVRFGDEGRMEDNGINETDYLGGPPAL